MNLLFQALAIFIVVLPGILCRAAYFQGGWKYPKGRLGSVSDEVPRALILAGVLNWGYYWIVTRFRPYSPVKYDAVDLDVTVYWLANYFANSGDVFKRAVKSLSGHPTQIFSYFVGLYFTSYTVGALGNFFVRKWKLDRVYAILQFDNDWHYLLRGETRDFELRKAKPIEKLAWTARFVVDSLPAALQAPIGGFASKVLTTCHKSAYLAARLPKPQQKIEAPPKVTMIAAVVDNGGTSYIYVGMLVEFHFTPAGELDRLVLSGVLRRRLADGDDPRRRATVSIEGWDRFYPIKCDFFILRMSEIKTLNVAYVGEGLVSDVIRNIEHPRPSSPLAPLSRPLRKGECRDRLQTYDRTLRSVNDRMGKLVEGDDVIDARPIVRELRELRLQLQADADAIDKSPAPSSSITEGAPAPDDESDRFAKSLALLLLLVSRLEDPNTAGEVWWYDLATTQAMVQSELEKYA